MQDIVFQTFDHVVTHNNKIDSHLRYLDKNKSLEKGRIMATSDLLLSVALSSNGLSVFRPAI